MVICHRETGICMKLGFEVKLLVIPRFSRGNMKDLQLQSSVRAGASMTEGRDVDVSFHFDDYMKLAVLEQTLSDCSL